MGILDSICDLLNNVLGGIAGRFPRFSETPIFGGLAALVDALCGDDEETA